MNIVSNNTFFYMMVNVISSHYCCCRVLCIPVFFVFDFHKTKIYLVKVQHDQFKGSQFAHNGCNMSATCTSGLWSLLCRLKANIFRASFLALSVIMCWLAAIILASLSLSFADERICLVVFIDAILLNRDCVRF